MSATLTGFFEVSEGEEICGVDWEDQGQSAEGNLAFKEQAGRSRGERDQIDEEDRNLSQKSGGQVGGTGRRGQRASMAPRSWAGLKGHKGLTIGKPSVAAIGGDFQESRVNERHVVTSWGWEPG